jgi:hypothetical protein
MNQLEPKLEKWTAPCQFVSLVESTKEETACIIYQRMIPICDCGLDCESYRPARGNA